MAIAWGLRDIASAMRISTLALGTLLLVACSKPPSKPPVEETPAPVTEDKADAEAGSDEQPGLTAATCEAQGGKVVGDIGDGAIHQPGYLCPDSGEPPLGSIVAEPGEPVAIEGAVCCK